MPDLSEKLKDQVLQARKNRRRLNIVGGGTKAFMGRTADSDADILDLSNHTGIVEYHPVELIMTVRAGTRVADIEAALAEEGQCLHFEPPRFGDASTLGGTLACNLSGPARPWSGSIRDQVLGVRLINGKGEDLRFGGQVMKNVAGYDVSRLQAGAMGTLGAITEISLKVMPRPAMSLTLVEDMPQSDVIRHMNQRAGESKPITGAAWVDGKAYLRLSGARSAVEATAEKWSGEVMEQEQGDDFWKQLQHMQHEFFAGDEPLWRFSIGSTAASPELDGPWLIDWAGSQRWYRGEADMAKLEGLARQAGGQVSLFRGGDRSDDVMQGQPEALQTIQKRLKESFDPDGIFNPGRLYSWL